MAKAKPKKAKSLKRQAISSVCRMTYVKRYCPSLSQDHTADRLRLCEAWLAGHRAARRSLESTKPKARRKAP